MTLALFFNGQAQDLEFWRAWIVQMQAGGYHALNANYPPLLLHWFYLFACLLETIDIFPHSVLLVKAWTQLPIFISHLFLLDRLGKSLSDQGRDPLNSACFWLTAFNPALLLNGPVWGQVDLLPFMALYFAFEFSLSEQKAHWSWPMLALALLCKFQAVVMAPLLCGLSLRFFKRHLIGAVLASLIFVLAFLPFILQGDGIIAFKRAYTDNLGIYPYSSLNAANLWYLLAGGSMQPDSISLLGGKWAGMAISNLTTPSKIGLVLFGLLSLIIAFIAIRKKALQDIYGLAVLSVVSFFAVSSGMHERYMFLALPFAALWGCLARGYQFWYPLLTALVYINMNFVLPLSGHAAWNLISICVMLTLIVLLTQTVFAQSLPDAKWIVNLAGSAALSPYLFLLALWLALVGNEIRADLKQNQAIEFGSSSVIFLSDLKPEIQQQDWGELTVNRNLNGHPICLGDRCYQQGLATHARSFISYKVPAEAKKFRAIVGLDAESPSGQVEFIVELNNKISWRSGPITGYQEPIQLTIDLANAKRIKLRVEALETIDYDHADWADARFER